MKKEIDRKYSFGHILESDYSNILTHLQDNFYIDEPVNKLLGTSNDRVSDQNQRYTDMIRRYPKCLCVTVAENNDLSFSSTSKVCPFTSSV